MEWPNSIKRDALWKLRGWVSVKLLNDEVKKVSKVTHSECADIVAVLPIYLDKKRRICNSFSIDKKNFDNKNNIEKPNPRIFASHIDTIKSGIERVDKGIVDKYLENHIEKFSGKIRDKKKLDLPTADICLKYFMRLPLPYNWFENGIARRILERSDGEKNLGEALYMRRSKKERVSEDTLKRTVYKFNSDSERLDELGNHEKIPTTDRRNNRLDEDIIEYLYNPLFALFGFDSIPGLDTVLDRQESIRNPCIFLPIYDNYINSKGYGEMQSSYLFYIKKDSDDPKIIINTIKYLLEVLKPTIRDVSMEIYLSNLFRVIEGEISKKPSYDFVDYFLQMIIYVQDWENIWVTTKSIEEIEKNKFTEKNINRYWKRKSPDEEEGEFTYEWIDSSNDSKEVEKLNEAVKDNNVFEFHIKEVAFLLDEGDTKDYKNILDGYLICEYPAASVIPNDTSDLKKYKENLTQRFLRVFEIAISEWQEDKYKNATNIAKGCIEQMSHNLHHALEGIMADLETLFDDENRNTPAQFIIRGSHKFSEYLHDRFEAFREFGDLPGENDSEPIDDSIDDFKKQKFFLKHITRATESSVEQVKIIPHIKGYEELEVPYQPLYMFLENYIRNVAKHQAIISSTLTCHIEISGIENSEYRMCIWEYSAKKLEIDEFYQQWEHLNSKHQEVQDNPPFGPGIKRGISAMEWLLKGLAYSRNTRLEVSPVVVLGSGEQCIRHKVEKDDRGGYYYMDEENKRISLHRNNNQRFSMEYSFNIQDKSN